MKTSIATLLLFLTPGTEQVQLSHKNGAKQDGPPEHLYDPAVFIDMEEEMAHELDDAMHAHHDELVHDMEELDDAMGDPLTHEEVDEMEGYGEKDMDWAVKENDS